MFTAVAASIKCLELGEKPERCDAQTLENTHVNSSKPHEKYPADVKVSPHIPRRSQLHVGVGVMRKGFDSACADESETPCTHDRRHTNWSRAPAVPRNSSRNLLNKSVSIHFENNSILFAGIVIQRVHYSSFSPPKSAQSRTPPSAHTSR